MSALPPKADISGACRHVCFGPKGDIAEMVVICAMRTWRHQRGSVTRSKGAGERRVTITGDTVERRSNKIVFNSRNAKGLPAYGFRYQASVPERVRQLTDGDGARR